MMPTNYLPGLNTVRFYAAVSVVVAHVWWTGHTPFFLPSWDAVTLFFTLSGYLITYRLLIERKRTGHIDLKAFYVRRELRILPLYYLTVVIGGVLLPLVGAPAIPSGALVATLLLVPQLPAASGASLGLIGQMWSIGVEELFYVTFPFLMRHMALVRLALMVIALTLLVTALAWAVNYDAYLLAIRMRFECMAVGALAAWVVVKQLRWLFVVQHRAVEAAALFGLVSITLFGLQVHPFHDLFFATLTAIFLVNISTKPTPIVRLEYRWSKAAGDLTYGVYVWHMIVIWLMAFLFTGHTLAVASIAGTIIIAALSYRFIEKPLLTLKNRWQSQPVLVTDAA